MAYTDTQPEICEDSHPFVSILKLVGIVAAAYFLSAFATFILMFVQGIDYGALSTFNGPSPKLRNFLLIAQTITSIIVFIIAPLSYIYLVEKKDIRSLNIPGTLTLIAVLLTFFIVLISFLPNSVLINWNKSLILPDFMESWAREKENLAEQVTKIFLDFNTPLDFLFVFIIIAVIAPIGEELLFRGLIQNKLRALTKNPHIAIWVTAIIFSAIHVQFYGFFPRMFLGVLFGYLYYWSGNIQIAILGHFVNNGFQVIALYLYKLKVHEINIDETPDVPWLTALSGTVITAGLMFSFWKHHLGKKLLQ